LLIALVVAPALAAVATIAARRFGARAGGVVSAFPAIVGPVLLVDALQYGDAFAARAANGTLLGLVALSGFAVAYGRTARTRGWLPSLAAGWACAALGALVAAVVAAGADAPVGLLVAVASLLVADRALPPAPPLPHSPSPSNPGPRASIPIRMLATALLVVTLSTAAGRLGPLIGGMLAALPVLASVLTVFSHRDGGSASAIALLRGMVRGMAGFVAFCEVLALLVVHGGLAPAVTAATLSALVIQTVSTRRMINIPHG
jgi:hypothetical protein